jgi:hypothetical protein
MPLSNHARRVLSVALKSNKAGDNVADIIDADGGTLSKYAKDRLISCCANRAVGVGIADAIDNDTVLTGREVNVLATMLGSRTVAAEISAELGS